MNSIFGDTIYTYTRAQAIEDGELVDVTAGSYFSHPTAMTRAAYEDLVNWDNTTETALQDIDGRLADVMTMAALHARQSGGSDRVRFEVLRIARGATKPTLAAGIVHIGPGDTAAPVITIMLPGED